LKQKKIAGILEDRISTRKNSYGVVCNRGIGILNFFKVPTMEYTIDSHMKIMEKLSGFE
jgi:hypothetical protein